MVGKIFQRSKLIASLTQAVGGVGGGRFFLVPKLQLGNPLWSKALLCKAHLEQYYQVMTIWCPSRAWAKNIRSQAEACKRGQEL
jgi:hypothetical protein